MIINLFENSYTYLLKCVAFWEDIYAIIGAQTGLVFLNSLKRKKCLKFSGKVFCPTFLYEAKNDILFVKQYPFGLDIVIFVIVSTIRRMRFKKQYIRNDFQTSLNSVKNKE